LATEDDKASIVDGIIDEIKSAGRFLARLMDEEAAAMGITSPKDPRWALWYEVRDVRRVRDKVKQSFQTNKTRREKEEQQARRSAPLEVRQEKEQRYELGLLWLNSCSFSDLFRQSLWSRSQG
jgi:hypothetical protein